jgi:5-methylcytosine-specific restriction protein A
VGTSTSKVRRISPPAIRAAYVAGKNVFEGKLTSAQAIRELDEGFGLNRNSARDLVLAYKQMMRGQLYQRGLSAPDTDYFLTEILAGHGPLALQTAVHSVWQHISYFERVGSVTLHKLRQVAVRHQALAGVPTFADETGVSFEKAVKRSLSEPAERRRKRLRTAPKIPTRVPIVVLGFQRNPDVVAEVLTRAGDSCEGCNQKAPFMRRKDGTPYLKVHHKNRLALGGEDTIENAIALCPNCHRQQHYG